ncbi:arginase-1 [Zerene cesonia]|uniref:arginase-1 n=1 Tax=Zerene cesonia TaxID=33412 RepID=UPI0018E4FF45|nr:arginase-1 [Zerene cesonia]
MNYASFRDWRIIEILAEEHPYIVALLSNTKNYTCTGVIISQRAILTSGRCVSPEPTFVAVNSAVVGKMLHRNNIFEIAFTRVHEDYMYEVNELNQNVTRMHSNLAIVFTVRAVLLQFTESAILGNYFESELKNKILSVTGYGQLKNSDVAVLQIQEYKQVACSNPKWYYCICGIEYSSEITYELPFGEGAPIFYEDEVVGITSCPVGSISLKGDVDYNIFTVITPYKTWITKTQLDINEHGDKKPRSKETNGLDVKDYGDIDIPTSHEDVGVDNMVSLPLVSACNHNVSKKVSQVLRDGRLAVTIGGDHSIGVGTVDGHYNVNEDMILIWVDAHADINTNKTSESGSVHGMPVALLVKELSDYWPYLPTMDWQVPKFSIKNLGYIGLRSVDHYERLAIEKYKVPTFAMEDVEDHGIEKSINNILHVLDPGQEKPIHVSFDIDSLDALEAPSTGTPVRGGLTLREGIKLMEIIHSTGRLRALDLVEINPAIGNDSDRKRTIEAGLCILKAALGFSRRGTAPRGVSDLPVQTHHNKS